MKKITILLVLIFTFLFSTTSWGEWIYVTDNEVGVRFYYDKDRVRKSGKYIYFWKLLDSPKPIEGDLFSMSPKQLSQIKTVPGSLEDALDALEKDHKFLLEGGVFTKEVIETWIAYKRENEVDEIRQRPHPHEFFLYYDI